MKDPHRKDDMAAARATLKESSKMLLSSSKVYSNRIDHLLFIEVKNDISERFSDKYFFYYRPVTCYNYNHKHSDQGNNTWDPNGRSRRLILLASTNKWKETVLGIAWLQQYSSHLFKLSSNLSVITDLLFILRHMCVILKWHLLKPTEISSWSKCPKLWMPFQVLPKPLAQVDHTHLRHQGH